MNMSLSHILVLFTACLAAMASPGPGVAALVTRAANAGIVGSLPFIAGMVAGDLVLFTVAMAGMATLGAALAPWLPLLSGLAGLWLLWLGWKQWLTADHPLSAATASASFMAAWLLTLGNPKTIIFYMALLPIIIGPQGLRLADAMLAALIVAVTLCLVMLGYAALVHGAMGFLRHPRPLRRLCALVMAAVGAGLLVRTGFSLG
ncbi:LysE family translocator [Magnetospirillum sulfuroxidans]|uniref:LysE family transporter n=1 Tax=Magnetospirillum sulfuroxidans TaxID=611300 RepID=A0ABS5I7J2_9PROT|nr:LysE family transporter [Magnetospirillum sulfuroxidans]MBR9970406.1 LysE family transporter [Magnetospirillum sulfuroxidans]